MFGEGHAESPGMVNVHVVDARLLVQPCAFGNNETVSLKVCKPMTEIVSPAVAAEMYSGRPLRITRTRLWWCFFGMRTDRVIRPLLRCPADAAALATRLVPAAEPDAGVNRPLEEHAAKEVETISSASERKPVDRLTVIWELLKLAQVVPIRRHPQNPASGGWSYGFTSVIVSGFGSTTFARLSSAHVSSEGKAYAFPSYEFSWIYLE